MTQLTIDVRPSQLEIVRETLQHAIAELENEISRADAIDYRHYLRARLHDLEAFRDQLEDARAMEAAPSEGG